jgi:hypothetical protein
MSPEDGTLSTLVAANDRRGRTLSIEAFERLLDARLEGGAPTASPPMNYPHVRVAGLSRF